MDSGIILPIIVFAVFVAGSWWLLTLISSRNSQAEDRLERMGRPKSLAEIDIASRRDTGMSGLKKMMEGMGASIASQQSASVATTSTICQRRFIGRPPRNRKLAAATR